MCVLSRFSLLCAALLLAFPLATKSALAAQITVRPPQGPAGTSATVSGTGWPAGDLTPADKTFCSRNRNFKASIKPGSVHYSWAIFHNVPPGGEVSIEWSPYKPSQSDSLTFLRRNTADSEAIVGRTQLAGEAITEKNWVSHPEIVEVRSLYQTIKASIDAGNLQRKERKFDYCEPYEDSVRTIYMDRNRKPRLYYHESGSDDSAVERELCYDESGKLRFAFIIARANNGTQLEHRIYFSKARKKIWEIQKRLEGPGYTFPTEWPDAEFIQDPVHAFNDMSPCTEIK